MNECLMASQHTEISGHGGYGVGFLKCIMSCKNQCIFTFYIILGFLLKESMSDNCFLFLFFHLII